MAITTQKSRLLRRLLILSLFYSINPPSTTIFCPVIKEELSPAKKAAVSAGCPEGAIGVIQRVSIEATNELMKHKDTNKELIGKV